MNAERTPYFFMANLGSELIRLFSFLKKQEHEYARESARRALLIVDQLLGRSDINNGRAEVEVLKMLVEDALSSSPRYRVQETELNSYFTPFALRATALKKRL